jgi:hypothetical protein
MYLPGSPGVEAVARGPLVDAHDVVRPLPRPPGKRRAAGTGTFGTRRPPASRPPPVWPCRGSQGGPAGCWHGACGRLHADPGQGILLGMLSFAAKEPRAEVPEPPPDLPPLEPEGPPEEEPEPEEVPGPPREPEEEPVPA